MTFPNAGVLSPRVVVGVTFLPHGLDKLGDLAGAEQLSRRSGSLARAQGSPFVGATQTVGGRLLIAGLAARLAGAALSVNMLVALETAHEELCADLRERGSMKLGTIALRRPAPPPR
jgi:uncharacterized membrane protein YphA (DoxX/SURF4 family)